MRLVLASASPQRREILASLGFEFEVRPSDVPEREGGAADEVALENALAKARAVAAALVQEAGEAPVVLGVDTVVAVDGTLRGKPADAEEARAMLGSIGGRTHEVVSGYALLDGGRERRGVARTHVTFADLDAAMLDWYVATGEWRGRAGGYAIQGRAGALVERIEGDYLNVVGLPVAAIAQLLPGLIGR